MANIISERRTELIFGGGGAENRGLGQKSVAVLSQYGNVMIDAGVSFRPWTEERMAKIPEWMRLMSHQETYGSDYSGLGDKKIDIVLLSHSHADHCADLPNLLRHLAPKAKVLASAHTLEILKKVLYDTLEYSPYLYKNAGGLFAIGDALLRRRSIGLGKRTILDGIKLYVFDAGHILGACGFVLEMPDGYSMLDTGDIADFDQPLLGGTNLLELIQNDQLPPIQAIIGTDFTHDSFEPFFWEEKGKELCFGIETQNGFKKGIKQYLEEGYAIYIAAFENSRTQNVAETIYQMLGVRPFIDGGGREIFKIYDRYQAKSGQKIPIDLSHYQMVESSKHREEIMAQPHGKVIISTSGMMEGGPMEWYLENSLTDERAIFFLVSYQAPGTKGAILLEKTAFDPHPEIELENGKKIKVRATIDRVRFTAHANPLFFVRLVQRIYEHNGHQRLNVFLTHGLRKTKKVVRDLISPWADCYIVEPGRRWSIGKVTAAEAVA